VLIARKRLEDKFVAALNEKVLNPELLDQVYERTATPLPHRPAPGSPPASAS
jgi:hypothetical protein